MSGNKKIAALFCDPRSLNEATRFYCGIVRKSLTDLEYGFITVHKLNDLKGVDVVFTITERYFLEAFLRYPQKKTIYWAQGVDAEEAKMQIKTVIQALRYLFRRFAEFFAINKADILLCVSERMVQYFKKKYRKKEKRNIFVMPCFNLKVSSYFNEYQYEKPIFAYAGNLSLWQGVDFMLDVYKLVEQEIPNAQLRLFTREKAEIERMIRDRNISNYCVSFIPMEELQEELHKCKYGFIIRTDHIVNQVSTPTKMNSYLASYVIPIYSDGVDDFKKNIVLNQYQIMATCPLDARMVASQIIEFEKNVKTFSDYKDIVNTIFSNHYNEERYINDLTKVLSDKHF